MAKLTLGVDAAVVERAKTYARRRGTSVSELVERYLDALARSSQGEAPFAAPPAGAGDALPPITARLSGLLAGSEPDLAGHRRHLEAKFR